MAAHLEVWRSSGSELVPLTDPIRVGRDPANDIVLDGERTVSRFHAEIHRTAAGWCVRDLASRNGTRVNGQPINSEQPLRAGDELRLGDARLIYRADEGAAGELAPTLVTAGPAGGPDTTVAPPPPAGAPVAAAAAPARPRPGRGRRLKRGMVVAGLAALVVAAVAASSALLVGRARAPAPVTYRRVSAIPWVPAAPTSVDIGWLDPGTQTYYLSDRSNGVVHVIDGVANREVARIPGFVGKQGRNVTSGPNGLVYVPERQELWVGDGDGALKIVDAPSHRVVARVPTGFKTRVDELAYDSRDRLVAATVPDVTPARLVLVSLVGRSVVASIAFPDATAGLEQPAWNAQDGDFYLAIPTTPANPGGEIDVIDPVHAVVRRIGVQACAPAGIIFGPAQHLLLGCGKDAIVAGAHASTVVLDAATGGVLATIGQVGGSDEVAYDPRVHRYYLAASDMTSDGTATGRPQPVLGVIDAQTNRWLANVPTSRLSHSVAVDPTTDQVFVPLTGAGIGVFAPQGG